MQVLTAPADENHQDAQLDEYDQNFEPFQQSQQALTLPHQNKLGHANEHQTEQIQRQIDHSNAKYRELEEQQQQKQHAEANKATLKLGIKAENAHQDKQSTIKETINRITKNIIFSKQEIVQNITSIDRYYQQNEKQIKQKHEEHNNQLFDVKNAKPAIKQKKEIVSKIQDPAKYRQRQYVQEGKLKRLQEKQAKQSPQVQQKKIERIKNKQIYEQRRLAKKEQEKLEKSRSMLKKMELQRRIAYEQKFISRRSLSPEVPISNEEIKQFENAFIRHIKERLKIGKVKQTDRPHQLIQPIVKQAVPAEYKKGYHKKVYKDEKLKQKILHNLKIQIRQELEPTYSSIQIDSNQLEDSAALERKRTHQSAPQLRLPAINHVRAAGRTFYSKQKRGKEKVHILKISDDKI